MSQLNETRIFSTDLRKETPLPNFMNIHKVGADMLHADGRADGQTNGRTDAQTDMTNVTIAFRNFASAPKTSYLMLCVGMPLLASRRLS